MAQAAQDQLAAAGVVPAAAGAEAAPMAARAADATGARLVLWAEAHGVNASEKVSFLQPVLGGDRRCVALASIEEDCSRTSALSPQSLWLQLHQHTQARMSCTSCTICLVELSRSDDAYASSTRSASANGCCVRRCARCAARSPCSPCPETPAAQRRPPFPLLTLGSWRQMGTRTRARPRPRPRATAVERPTRTMTLQSPFLLSWAG
mmetsp:Transcript_13784/g.43064  ORF Transcript_13784/g.43064 Transcript_13784/m.43064 type:complete len:207 (+) Transcript_13784:461-1081(+)